MTLIFVFIPIEGEAAFLDEIFIGAFSSFTYKQKHKVRIAFANFSSPVLLN
jgi:hypothetical protein